MSNLALNLPVEKFTRTVFNSVIERISVLMSEKNLSFSQFAALHIVDQTKSITIQKISARLNLSLSATSRLVDGLVKIDFLNRIEDQKNRRSKLLTLTQQGQSFLNKLSAERVKIIRSNAKALPEKVSNNFLNAVGLNKKGKI